MPRAHGWSEREVERRSGALARLLRRAWRAVSRAVSGSLAERPEALVTASNLVQPVWDEHVRGEVLGYIGNVYLDAAEDVLLDAGMPDDLLIGDDLVQLYLRTATNRLRGVGDHAWARVRDQLTEGQRLGETLDEIAARVAGTAGVSDARALTIARTEVHAAAESAAWEQARYVDPEALKIWLATNDERTRPTHRVAEGQAVSMNELFVIGDSKLRFPGDPEGDPGETINCRCTLVFDFDVPSSELNTADDDEFVVAAGKKKWNPTAHPRGKDGRFIKKGAVQTLLSKKKPLLGDVAVAVKSLDQKQWDNLTDEQQDYVIESVSKLPAGSQLKLTAESDLAKFQSAEQKSATMKPQTSQAPPLTQLLKSAKHGDVLATGTWNGKKFIVDADLSVKSPVFYPDGRMRLRIFNKDGSVFKQSVGVIGADIEDLLHENDAKFTWDVLESPSAPAPKSSPTSTPAPPKPSAPAIPAHKGAAPGAPAKVSTALIWGKYDPGTVILEAADEQVVWNGKKYEFRVGGDVIAERTKKDTYAQLKDDTHWQVPGASAASQPTAEDFAADMKAMWQAQWEKGLVTTEEFTQQFNESPLEPEPEATTKTAPPPVVAPLEPPPVSTPTPAADWPKQVTVSGPKDAVGKPALGTYGGAGHNTAKQLQDAATKPANFNPNAGEQTGRAAFYAALQSHDYDPGDNLAWNALRTYQSHAADNWNRALRHDIPLEDTGLSAQQVAWVKKAQPKLDEMMAQSSLPATLRVWRGVRDPDGKLAAKLKKGSIFEDKGYVSTATERSVAETFTGGGSSGLLFDIEVPKGEQGLTPTKWSGRFLDEWELVLPRGSKFEVLEEPKPLGNGKEVVKLRVVTAEHNDIMALGAPTTPEVVPEPVVTPTATPAASPPVTTGSTLLTKFMTGGTLTPTEAVQVVKDLDNFDWVATLNDDQRARLIVAVDDAIDANVPGAVDAFQKLHGLQQGVKPVTSLPPAPPPPAEILAPSPAQPGLVSWPDVVENAKDYPAGTVVAVSQFGSTKVVKTQHGDFEVQNAQGTQLAIYGAGNIEDGDLQADWPNTTWVTPTAAATAPSATPASVPPAPVTPTSPPTPPAAPAPTTPAPSGYGGADTSAIPDTHKKMFKQVFKQQKLGYWSKPEAIWDQVVDLKVLFPQYTPLQILASLDEQLKVKDPNPFQTKISKWLGTAKGKAKIGDLLDAKSSEAVDDISHLTQATLDNAYAHFKQLPSTYYTSDPVSIYAALKNTAEKYQLSITQVLKVVDQVGSEKVKKPNEFLFEKKIKNWLKTPTGAAAVSPSGASTALEAGMTVGAPGNPRIPKIQGKWDPNKLLPSRAASDTLTYPVKTVGQMDALWADITKKYGDWSAHQTTHLKEYTGGDFEPVNDYLWQATGYASSGTLTSINAIQSGMRPSTQAMQLIRGTDYGVQGRTDLAGLQAMIGQTWRGDGFFSTTAGKEPGYNSSAKVWLRIEAPPGTPLAWMRNNSYHKLENEVLLAAGLHYEILDVQEETPLGAFAPKYVVRLRVVPEPGGTQ